MDENFLAPEFYVVNRILDGAQKRAVRHALSMTPIECAIVTDVYDVKLAHELNAPYVVSARFETEARAQAKRHFADSGKPALVIGHATFLEGHYGDGHIETLA